MVAIVEDSFNYITKMCTTRLRDATIEMIGAAHEYGCRVVVSGSDATDRPRRYLDGGADAVLLGEAEATLAEVAALWRDDVAAPLDAIAGLALRDPASDEMTVTAPRSGVRDLDALPLPAWDLVDADATAAPGAARTASIRGTGDVARLSVRLQLVREAGVRPPLRTALAGVRGGGAPSPQGRRRAGPHLVRRRHLRAHGTLDRRVRQEVRAARRMIPFMIQCRADLVTPTVARNLALAAARRCGWASSRDRSASSTRWTRAPRWTRCARRHARSARPYPFLWLLQLGYPSEHVGGRDRDARPRARGAPRTTSVCRSRIHCPARSSTPRCRRSSVRARTGGDWRARDALPGHVHHGVLPQARDALHDEVLYGADEPRSSTSAKRPRRIRAARSLAEVEE